MKQRQRKYLIDTHIFIWFLKDDPQLPQNIRTLLSDQHNEVLLSVASVWEIVIKQSKGKLRMPKNIEKIVKASGFTILSIELPHVQRIASLPHLHNDPFDRILISQALEENCTLVTTDHKIEKYQVRILH